MQTAELLAVFRTRTQGSVVLAALFVGIEWCIRVAGHLPEAYYFRASISLGLIQSFLNLPGLALLGLSVIAVVVLRTNEEGRAILRAWVGPQRQLGSRACARTDVSPELEPESSEEQDTSPRITTPAITIVRVERSVFMLFSRVH